MHADEAAAIEVLLELRRKIAEASAVLPLKQVLGPCCRACSVGGGYCANTRCPCHDGVPHVEQWEALGLGPIASATTEAFRSLLDLVDRELIARGVEMGVARR